MPLQHVENLLCVVIRSGNHDQDHFSVSYEGRVTEITNDFV